MESLKTAHRLPFPLPLQCPGCGKQHLASTEESLDEFVSFHDGCEIEEELDSEEVTQ